MVEEQLCVADWRVPTLTPYPYPTPTLTPNPNPNQQASQEARRIRRSTNASTCTVSDRNSFSSIDEGNVPTNPTVVA
jgi:hypothetical protein